MFRQEHFLNVLLGKTSQNFYTPPKARLCRAFSLCFYTNIQLFDYYYILSKVNNYPLNVNNATPKNLSVEEYDDTLRPFLRLKITY